MKDQLVSIETARLLAYKGFDELCSYIVNIGDNYNNIEYIEPISYNTSNHTKAFIQGENNETFTKNSTVANDLHQINGSSEEDDYICIPTIYTTQKWLRDKHSIHINPRHNVFNQRYSYTITGSYHEGEKGVLKQYDFKDYNTYEEAMEHGILEALTFIK